jgi:protein-disulfide isomerase
LEGALTPSFVPFPHTEAPVGSLRQRRPFTRGYNPTFKNFKRAMPDATLSVPVTKADHVEGEDTAVITLVEYGDYQCPFCGQAYGLVKEIQRKMSYRLRFVFRNFPLTGPHPFAEIAAEAAESAGAQGKFWQMHDLLYENQDRLGYELLASAAATLSLDVEGFVYDIRGGRFRERIKRDFKGGVRSGVNGTPCFFIDGARFDGSWESGELAEELAMQKRQ